MIAHERQTTGDSAPTLQIRPNRGWVALDFRELWSYHELAYFFVWRDLGDRSGQAENQLGVNQRPPDKRMPQRPVDLADMASPGFATSGSIFYG